MTFSCRRVYYDIYESARKRYIQAIVTSSSLLLQRRADESKATYADAGRCAVPPSSVLLLLLHTRISLSQRHAHASLLPED